VRPYLDTNEVQKQKGVVYKTLSTSGNTPLEEVQGSPLIGAPLGDWKIEGAKKSALIEKSYPLVLPEHYQEFYQKEFCGKEHEHYIGNHIKEGPIVISACLTMAEPPTVDDGRAVKSDGPRLMIQCLLRTEKVLLVIISHLC
jgi:hypothetical protein